MKMAQEYLPHTNIRIDTNQRIATNKTGTEEILPFITGAPESARWRDFPGDYKEALDFYNIQTAAEQVMAEVARLDRRIQETEPFKLIKRNTAAGQKIITELVAELAHIAQLLLPIIPVTVSKIKSAIEANAMPEIALFPRK